MNNRVSLDVSVQTAWVLRFIFIFIYIPIFYLQICQSRFKWRHPASSVWAGHPPLFLGLTGIPLLVTLFWGNRWQRPKPLQSPSWYGGNTDLWLLVLTQEYVCTCCSFSSSFCSRTKGASVPWNISKVLGKKWTFCPTDCCETLTERDAALFTVIKLQLDFSVSALRWGQMCV